MSRKWGPGTTFYSRARLVGLVLFVITAFTVLAVTGPISVERARDLGEGIGPVGFVVVSALLSVAFERKPSVEEAIV